MTDWSPCVERAFLTQLHKLTGLDTVYRAKLFIGKQSQELDEVGELSACHMEHVLSTCNTAFGLAAYRIVLSYNSIDVAPGAIFAMDIRNDAICYTVLSFTA